MRKHISHMASTSNAVMRPKTGDMEVKNSGVTGTRTTAVLGAATAVRFAHRRGNSPTCSASWAEHVW
jgi:hypothetical protein